MLDSEIEELNIGDLPSDSGAKEVNNAAIQLINKGVSIGFYYKWDFIEPVMTFIEYNQQAQCLSFSSVVLGLRLILDAKLIFYRASVPVLYLDKVATLALQAYIKQYKNLFYLSSCGIQLVDNDYQSKNAK